VVKIRAPRGTHDVLPAEAGRWEFLEETFKKICRLYNFGEIRTPMFEETELFVRGVGEESDIVKKEMYTFKDRGGRELALRPEGTAGIVRAYIERGLHNVPHPVKLYYCGPMFRYDRPQAGRQRQFYQMGIEVFGSREPACDVEVIEVTAHFFEELGLKDLQLHINSVGCRDCRPAYQEHLSRSCLENSDLLCDECRRRVSTNPLRILDCKLESCAEVMKGAPQIGAHLCSCCREHFEEVLALLGSLNRPYVLDEHLVRGLDYYTNTAFEFISTHLGAQNSLGGGGRYDNLVETCGGAPTPGVGMALGVERVLLAMEKGDLSPWTAAPEGAFLAFEGSGREKEELSMLYRIRRRGIRADRDYLKRSLKAKMKFANRNNFRYVLFYGEEEEKRRKIKIRDMSDGTEQEMTVEQAVAFLVDNSE